MVRGQISEYIPNPTFEVVARPGAQEEYFRVGNPEGKSRREIFGEPMRAIPAFREPAARLELMDELGLDRTLMFPTLASLIEERMRDDPELIHVVIHALNEWIHETWTFNYKDRIFTTPVISLPIVDKAIEELEWVVERGAKVVLVRPAPVPGSAARAPSGCPSSTRSGRRSSSTTSWSRCTRRTAATSGTPTTGWGATARCCRSSRRRSGCSRRGGRSRTRCRPWSATARCPASRP